MDLTLPAFFKKNGRNCQKKKCFWDRSAILCHSVKLGYFPEHGTKYAAQLICAKANGYICGLNRLLAIMRSAKKGLSTT